MSGKRKHSQIERRNENLNEKVNKLERNIGGILSRLNNIRNIRGNTLENYTISSTNYIYIYI